MLKNKNQTSDKQPNGNDLLADVMSSICAVSNGWGEASTYIKVGNSFGKQKITRIEKTEKVIGKGYYNDLTITCYVVYDENDNKIIEINEGVNTEVVYCS